MKTILASMILMLSVTASAKNSHLICMTGDIGDMDIKIEDSEKGKQKLSVILTGMDGETIRT